MGDEVQSLKLRLGPSPVRAGEDIVIIVRGVNVPQITIDLYAPDTVVVAQPHRLVCGPGNFEERFSWRVERAQAPATVEITTSPVPQTVLCNVLVD